MVQITVHYDGDLRTCATHGPSQATLVTDPPVDNQGRGESFSPTDLVATALGTCMLTIMGIAAARKDVPLVGATAVVRKIMTAEPPRKIARLEVDITLPLPPDHPDRALLEAAALGCPVFRSLDPAMEKPVQFLYSH